MRVTRKLIKNSKWGRSIMIPGMWLEQLRNRGIEPENVIIDIEEDKLIISLERKTKTKK
jgi:hypothetical protein